MTIPAYPPAAAVRALLACADECAQHDWLTTHYRCFDAAAITLLKSMADRALRTDPVTALRIGNCLRTLGALQGVPTISALGLVVTANSYSVGGQGEYAPAVDAYAQAIALYQAEGAPLAAGRALVGQLFALAALGQHTQAFAAGEEANAIFHALGADAELAGLQWNLAILYSQQGNDQAALDCLDAARAYHTRLGDEGAMQLALIDQNRAIVLRNLGEFTASIAASQQAHAAFLAQGATYEAARTQQNLAHTYLIGGRYQAALALLEAAGQTFMAADRHADAMVVELQLTSCLLHLRQFALVLRKCEALQRHFLATGEQLEWGQTLLNGALASAGLGQFTAALALLGEVQTIFTPERHAVWHAMAELERAAILLQAALGPRAGEHQPVTLVDALATCEAAGALFAQQGLVVHAAQADLLSARIAHRLGERAYTKERLLHALAIGEKHDLPTLIYQVHALAGALCHEAADLSGASAAYAQAIQALERLCEQTVADLRPTFLEDKGHIYEAMVDLCLALQDADQGFAYAERAKSRALLTQLATVPPSAKREAMATTQPLLQQLAALRQEWNALQRQLTLGPAESGMTTALSLDSATPTRRLRQMVDARLPANTLRHSSEGVASQQRLLTLEMAMTDLWRQVQIRRGGVDPRRSPLQRDGGSARSTGERQPLPADTVLVEYFAVGGCYVAFVVTAHGVHAIRLQASERQVTQALRLLELNWRAVQGAAAPKMAALVQNAQGLLHQLYQLLWAPVATAVGEAQQVRIVPHGVLHQLPFHALFDGVAYLLERYPISYLPSADLLPHCQLTQPVLHNALVVGHSYGGRLPHAVAEAQAVAAQMGGRLLLEAAATQANLHALLGQSHLIHLATHGYFRGDNYLFSGLALEDGWLTTLDISNLTLQASLVTLSACQTGCHIVGGGDELLGLLRAFLGAGAASLVATLWAVEDGSTAQLMGHFYQALAAGMGKGAALRQAQLHLLRTLDGPTGCTYAHPYYWAPFFLVGDTGPCTGPCTVAGLVE